MDQRCDAFDPFFIGKFVICFLQAITDHLYRILTGFCNFSAFLEDIY